MEGANWSGFVSRIADLRWRRVLAANTSATVDSLISPPPPPLQYTVIPKSFGRERRTRLSLCTHAFHLITNDDLDIHVLGRRMPTTDTHPDCTINEK